MTSAADNVRYAKPGQRLRRLSVREIQRWILAADLVLGTGAGAGDSIVDPTNKHERQVGVIAARNSTGADLLIGQAARISGPVFQHSDNADEFMNMPTLDLDVSTGGSNAGLCIVTETMADGAIGRVAVSGIVPAKVDISDSSHKWAWLDVSATPALKSGHEGEAEIISSESATGTGVWCLLQIGLNSPVHKIIFCKVTSNNWATPITGNPCDPGGTVVDTSITVNIADPYRSTAILIRDIKKDDVVPVMLVDAYSTTAPITVNAKLIYTETTVAAETTKDLDTDDTAWTVGGASPTGANETLLTDVYFDEADNSFHKTSRLHTINEAGKIVEIAAEADEIWAYFDPGTGDSEIVVTTPPTPP